MQPLQLVRFLKSSFCKAPKRLSLEQEKRYIALSLLSIGFKIVGAGSFGVVFASGALVVKVVLTKESLGALSYARLCRASHAKNLILPKVFNISQIGRYSCILMERLHEKGRMSKSICPSLKQASKDKEYAACVGRFVGRSSPSSERVILKIHKIINAHPRSFWDIRAENIMFRKERSHFRPVLLDPVAY